MMLLKPLPRAVTRPLSIAVLIAWVVCMGALVNRSYLQASAANLATDLARYGSSAVWRGLYYRGEKIGFTVSQVVPIDGGYELQEDGRLQMTLLGASSIATIHTLARVDRAFLLQSFEFSLDPGTGAIAVRGRVEPAGPAGAVNSRLIIDVTSPSGTRTESRDLTERPVLSMNMSRLLASGGLVPGRQHRFTIFDPATLGNAAVVLKVGEREIVRGIDRPLPAFRVDMEFQGLKTTSWVTDTGEVMREESPMGLMTVQESPERAQRLAVPGSVRSDLLRAAAVVPLMSRRIDEVRDVERLRLRLEGTDLSGPEFDGAGQTVMGDIVEITNTRTLRAGPGDPDAERYLAPESLIESDAPEIRAEAETGIMGHNGTTRDKAERLVRYVNALLEKKPTVSLPSAREVLRTKVGDCNEHTALYVAMARSVGIPSRINVGLVYMYGAFYYHAWPEVYVEESGNRGYWLPVDPTLNQFPSDATHIRLARGGLEKQAAILPMIGQLKITVLDLDLTPGSVPILVGEQPADFGQLPVVTRTRGSCRCSREAGTR